MIVYCLGMEASGSTWLYNVVREIFKKNGLPFAAFRVEEFEQIADDRAHNAKNIIMRAHNVSSYLLRYLEAAEVKSIISTRDPRDAVTSCIQRFGDYGGKLIPTCNDITRNLASALSARAALPNLSFYYEDNFTQRISSIVDCAMFLGMEISYEDASEIHSRYTPERIQNLLTELENSKDERIYIDEITNNHMDRETSFHKRHISDMRVGKWRDFLNPMDREQVEPLFNHYADFLEAARSGAATTLQPGFSVQFSGKLFSPVDSMFHFTRQLPAGEVTSVLGVKVLSDIYLPHGKWQFHFSTDNVTGPTVLKACQNGQKFYQGECEAAIHQFDTVNILHDHPFDFNLAYPGMEEDASKGRMSPECKVSATLLASESGAES